MGDSFYRQYPAAICESLPRIIFKMRLTASVGALWYLQSRSAANAVMSRLRRLRQPKYLIGAVLGFGYLLSIFGRWIFYGSYLRHNSGGLPLPTHLDSFRIENLVATVLLASLVPYWIFAKDRAALAFTEPEVALLFPAPLSRRLLVSFRLFRSQTSVLFSTLVLTFISGRLSLGFHALIPALGWWVILSTRNLHGLGVSFAVQRLTERGLAGWRRQLLTLAIPAVSLLLLFLWYRALPHFPTGLRLHFRSLGQLDQFADEIFSSGPAPWLLAPFRLLVRPMFARDFGDALWRLLPALGLMGAHVFWVLHSVVSFEEASLVAARRRAEIVAARGPNHRLQFAPKTRGTEPFPLPPIGPVWLALLWRGMLETRTTPRRCGIIAGITVSGALLLRAFLPNQELALLVGFGALVGFVLFTFIGGQFAARKLAAELRRLDLVKAFPIAGWQVTLGALLGGVVSTALAQWLLLTVGAILIPSSLENGFSESLPTRAVVVASLLAAALVGPLLSLYLSLPVSVGIVLFPAWFASSTGSPGLEATGQRLLVALFQLSSFLLGSLPLALMGVPLFFLGHYLFGNATGILLAALGGATLLILECGLGIWWIGRRFDGLDLVEER